MRGIGVILGGLVGAVSAFILGMENGGSLVAIAWTPVGVAVGILLGTLLVYVLAGVVVVVLAVVMVLGLAIYVAGLALGDLFKRER